MGGWILEVNLEPFVALVALVAGYTLYSKDYDLVAIQYGIQGTDADEDRWYSYPFDGNYPVLLELAREPDASEIMNVRVTSATDLTPDISAQLELLISICQDYMLTNKSS